MCASEFTSVLPIFDHMDHSLPSSSVHDILQARIVEWVPFPSPRDLPNPGTEPTSLKSPTWAGRFFYSLAPPGKPILHTNHSQKNIL